MTDRRTVLIQVEEAKHILVVPGVGVKEYAGPRALLDISHTNLFGLNQSLTFRFRVGVEEQQFQTTYRQPRLFNHDDLEGIGALTLGVAKPEDLQIQRCGFVRAGSKESVGDKDVHSSRRLSNCRCSGS